MVTLTKRGVEIAASANVDGALRSVVNGEMQTWMTEVEVELGKISGQTITPLSVHGTAPDGTDCLAAFQSLSENYPGEAVNLLGQAWFINAADPPHNLQFVNGTIRTTTREINYPGSPRTHMFEGDQVVELERRPGTHHWPGPIGELIGASVETTIISYVPGNRHNVVPGAPIIVTHRSDGMTPDRVFTYWSNRLYEPRGLAGGMVSDSVFGIAFILVDAGSTHPADPVRFAYSTDGGKTKPTEQVMTNFDNAYYPHSFKRMANGVCWFFGMRDSRYVIAQKRTVGGTFETPIVVLDCNTRPGHQVSDIYAEPCVEYVPGYGWYGLVRDNDGDQPNYYNFTASDDFSEVSGLVDSGLTNERNPPKVTYWAGKLVHTVTSRHGTVVAGRRDELLFWVIPVAEAFAAVEDGEPISAIGRHFGSAVALPQTAIGYLEITQLNSGRWVMVGAAGESQLGSANPQAMMLFMVGGNPAPTPSPNTAMNPPIRYLGLNNLGYPEAWNGTSWTGITAATKTVPCHRHSSNVGVDVEQVELAGSIHEYASRVLHHRPTHALRIERASGASGTEQTFRIYGRRAIMEWSSTPISWARWMSGTVPTDADAHRFVIRINAGSGGSGAPADETVVWDGLGLYEEGLNLISGIAKIADLSAVVWGTDPYLEVAFINNAAGTMDAWDFGWWVNEGHTLIFPRPADSALEKAMIERRAERKRMPASGSLTVAVRASSDDAGVGTLSYSPKDATPTIYLANGATHSSFQIDGVGTDVLTNLIFGDRGSTSAIVLAYRTGYYTTFNARRIQAIAAVDLIIEAYW